MRTASNLISYEEALAIVQEHAKALPAEELVLDHCLNRYLAEGVAALIDSPPFDNSAVDGYALGSAGTEFDLVGESAAGKPWRGSLAGGQAVRIFTGAPIPPGTTRIAMAEDCIEAHGAVRVIEFGDYVRRRGSDFAAGTVLAERGDKLRPQLMGLLAAGGVSKASVARQPSVHIVSSGAELASRGSTLSEAQVYNTSELVLRGALEERGFQVTSSHVGDDLGETISEVEKALAGCDVLVTTGGVSVGRHDHMKEAFAAAGAHELFWGVSIRPGKPLWFGALEDKLIFGLPGNALSSFATFVLFVVPALEQRMGAKAGARPITARIARETHGDSRRTHFALATLRCEDGELWADPAEKQQSHMQFAAGAANCLVRLPVAAVLQKGDLVDVFTITSA